MRYFYNVKRAFVWLFGSALFFATWMLRKTIDAAFDSSLMNSFENALCFGAIYCVIAMFYESYLRLRTGNWSRCKLIDIASVISVWLLSFSCVALTRRPSEVINGIVWKYEVYGDEATIGRKGNLFWRSALSDATIGEVVIPSIIGGCNVRRIGENAFYGCKGVTSVEIPEGVRSIGSGAFAKCGLVAVMIPKSVMKIYDYAFAHCEHMNVVTMLEGVSDIGDQAFEGCSKLYTVVIPKSVVTIGRDAFSGCPVKTIFVEKGDAERVKRLLGNSCVSMELINFEEIGESHK